jgi:hypothetical protein
MNHISWAIGGGIVGFYLVATMSPSALQHFRCYSGIAAFLATAAAMIVGSLLKPAKAP